GDAAGDSGGGRAEAQRRVVGDQVAVRAAAVVAERNRRGRDRGVEREGEAGRGGVAGGVGVGDHDGVAAVRARGGVGARRAAAVDREGARLISGGRDEAQG